MTQSVKLEAVVDARERPALVAAAQQLSEALRAADRVDWPIQLRFWDADGDVASAAAGAVVILSLMPDAETDEPLHVVEARWRERIAALTATGAAVMIMTVFRSVADRATTDGAARLERIRRLSRMALDLSHDLHAAVVDIDRAFAHIGGRILQCDYQIAGRVPAEVAGHSVVWAVLSLGLDDTIPVEVQEAAKAFHGPLKEINTLVQRRLSQVAA